jgi:1,4-dihydroxy-2-naphthoate octaprenyltransferase
MEILKGDLIRNMHAKQSKIKVWILASRPKTLPAAASPVIVGSAVAYYAGLFRFGPAVAALLAALLLQIGANLANDVFDFHKGADAGERLGPTRVTQSGLLPPKQVQMGMWVTFGLAALLGIYLAWVAGWLVIIVGLASILAAVAYTGGPFPFGYYGLGDLFVFFFFGPVAVCGTYFVQAGSLNWLVFWASLPMGFLITAILVVNNLRDINSDRLAGKMTLAVRLGVQGARLEYLFCAIAALLIPVGMWLTGLLSVWIMLSWLIIPMAVSLIRQVWHWTGRQLNITLAGTGRFTLLYALLFSIGVLLSI